MLSATHRKVAIVMTDGADMADNSSTMSEARTLLQKKNIPLYAMVIEKNNRGRANTYIQATGEFARSTGGVAVVFHAENAVGKLSGLLDGIHNAYVVSAQTANNRLSHTTMKSPLIKMSIFSPVSDEKVLPSAKMRMSEGEVLNSCNNKQSWKFYQERIGLQWLFLFYTYKVTA